MRPFHLDVEPTPPVPIRPRDGFGAVLVGLTGLAAFLETIGVTVFTGRIWLGIETIVGLDPMIWLVLGAISSLGLFVYMIVTIPHE